MIDSPLHGHSSGRVFKRSTFRAFLIRVTHDGVKVIDPMGWEYPNLRGAGNYLPLWVIGRASAIEAASHSNRRYAHMFATGAYNE